MTPIRVLIIDDEIPAREIIKYYLQDYQNIEIVGESDNGFDAMKLITNLNPHLIFLDVQMPKLTGFEMLELLDNPPQIIFSTAYDQYAVSAFEQNAVDYLLKPYPKERFDIAVKKAISVINSETSVNTDLFKFKERISNRNGPLSRIAVKDSRQIHVISIENIQHIEAYGDYVKLHTSKGRFLKEKTMKYFEENLPQPQFIRIHRSTIVNLEEVAKIELYEKESYRVHLKNGTILNASPNGYKLLKDRVRW